MDDILLVLGGPWNWRWDVGAALSTMGLTYIAGWVRLRRQGYRRLARYRPLLAYLVGLLTIAVALMSPIDTLQALLFFVHMFQHQLLIYLAPPLTLAGRALPFTMWGLPAPLRLVIGTMLTPTGWLRRALKGLTRPAVAFALSTGILWLWHLPVAYNAVLVNGLIHDIQHLTFFGSALLYWWALIDSPPQRAWIASNGGRGLYLALGAVQSAILGGLITFADRVLYTNYLLVPRLGGISAATDQQIGGALMWFSGPLIFGLAAAFLMREE